MKTPAAIPSILTSAFLWLGGSNIARADHDDDGRDRQEHRRMEHEDRRDEREMRREDREERREVGHEHERREMEHRPGPLYRARMAPPPMRAEVRPMAPSPRHVWVGGYWGFEGGRHAWVGGRWELPPQPGRV